MELRLRGLCRTVHARDVAEACGQQRCNSAAELRGSVRADSAVSSSSAEFGSTWPPRGGSAPEMSRLGSPLGSTRQMASVPEQPERGQSRDRSSAWARPGYRGTADGTPLPSIWQ
jgi:hypothetical protein